MTKKVALLVADCPSDADMDARLSTLLADATSGERHHGMTWYGEARAFAQSLADETGHSVTVTIAVISALSPMTHWRENALMAAAILRNPSVTEYAPGKRLVGYPANHAKAKAIVTTGNPDLLRGQKVTRFRDCIAGIDLTACIDSHATKAATGLDVDAPGACYDRIAAAYERLAVREGMTVPQAQAIVWLVQSRQSRKRGSVNGAK